MDTLQAADGYAATYRRAASTVSLTVWLGRTIFASNDPAKARIEYGELDVMVRADELILSGSVTTPADGDRIALTINGTAMTVEAMRPSNTDEPSARYADPQRELWRIHCKRVI